MQMFSFKLLFNGQNIRKNKKVDAGRKRKEAFQNMSLVYLW